MRSRRSLIVVAAAAAALALPVTALGQSAGDEQYADPFAPQEPAQQEPQAQQPVEPQAAPEQPAEPTAEAPATTEGGDASVTVQESQADVPTLPVTGMPALALLATGAGLVAAGSVLRRRL
jgi:hypothetical protein